MKKSAYLLPALAAFALITCALRLHVLWPLPFSALFTPADNLPLAAAVIAQTQLPQMAMALAAGACFGLSSAALQHIVRNPLASDSTLAVGSGAQLSLMAATLFFPALAITGSFWAALAGAVLSLALVMFIALPAGMNPLTMILGGLIVSILCSAAGSVITLFYVDELQGIMQWGAGDLLQDGWADAAGLAPVPIAGFLLLALLSKPLQLLALNDEQAKRLGAPVGWLRMAVLLTAAALAAAAVSRVGIVAFIGLAGASFANVLPIRHFLPRMAAAAAAAGLLLLSIDNLLALLSLAIDKNLPAGAVTGFLGAPLVIFLVLNQRKARVLPADNSTMAAAKRAKPRRLWLLAGITCAVFILCQLWVNSAQGWHASFDWALTAAHRLPRSAAAAAVGAMLACTGVFMQTITRNPMASPEVLGISAGAACGTLLGFLLMPAAGAFWHIAAGFAGAFGVTLLILWLVPRLQPAYLLLTGIAVGAAASGVMTIVKLNPNPQLQQLLSWLSGTTYNSRPKTALWLCVIAALLCGSAFLFVRSLRVMSLGTSIASSLGANTVRDSRLMLLLVALLSTAAALAVGPLSFIGLMTPHVAKRLGAVTPQYQLPAAMLCGALIMLLADWTGRYLIFPYEIPAGTLASLLGGSYFLLLLWRGKTAGSSSS